MCVSSLLYVYTRLNISQTPFSAPERALVLKNLELSHSGRLNLTCSTSRLRTMFQAERRKGAPVMYRAEQTLLNYITDNRAGELPS